jgi:hypothetical protein
MSQRLPHVRHVQTCTATDYDGSNRLQDKREEPKATVVAQANFVHFGTSLQEHLDNNAQ